MAISETAIELVLFMRDIAQNSWEHQEKERKRAAAVTCIGMPLRLPGSCIEANKYMYVVIHSSHFGGLRIPAIQCWPAGQLKPLLFPGQSSLHHPACSDLHHEVQFQTD